MKPKNKSLTESQPDQPQPALNRRRFLSTSLGAAAAITASQLHADAAQQPGSGQGGGKGPGTGGGKGPGKGGGKGGGGGGGEMKPAKFSALSLGNSNTSPTFKEAEVVEVRAQNGLSTLNLELDVTMTNWRFSCGGGAMYAQVPIYNNAVPGPTITVDPGSRLNITLSNQLPTKSPWKKDSCPTDHAHATSHEPQCFMHTNLHLHGLFVSPSSILKDGSKHCVPSTAGNCGPVDAGLVQLSSDDVLVNVGPGTQNNYGVNLPDFHEPGTYWYHAHIHGSTGYQVSSGMAGALIIREPAGQELVQPDRDKIFLMQEVIFASAQDPMNIPPVYTEKSTTANTAGFLINGQCKPTLQMTTGQTQRWRFINATGTPRGLMKLRLIKMSNNPQAVINDADVFDCGPDPTAPANQICPVKPALAKQNVAMNLIAVDGMSFYGFAPQPVKQHLMASGNRADFLINIPLNPPPGQVGGPGKYVLVKDGFPKDATSFNLNPSLSTTNANKCAVFHTVPASLRTTQVLAYIEVYPANDKPDQLPAVIPGTRPAHLQAIASYDNQQTVNFNTTNSGQGPGKGEFLINNTIYDPASPGITAKLNTAEQWTVTNTGNDIPHPFHIHVNPFQVVGRTIDFETDKPTLDPKNPCNWIWMDTLALPATISPTIFPPITPPVTCDSGHTGQIQLRTRFLVFPGQYVLHCHILIHEDRGMMTNVTIQDDGNGIGPCQPLAYYPPATLACINRTKQSC